MKLILTHLNPDFDALASLALAKLLHPDARVLIQGGVHPRIEAFVRLYRDVLHFYDGESIDPEKVSALIVVDTSTPERLGSFADLLERVPVTVYDHHPKSAGSIAGGQGMHRTIGACASLLTLMLETQSISIPAEIASLALLGIHEDTGSLSYTSTTADDYRAAALLMDAGASLKLLQEFHSQAMGQEHRDSWQLILDSAVIESIQGLPVVISRIAQSDYIYGLASLAEQLMPLFAAAAALLVVEMDAQTLVIGRAQARHFDMGAALAEAFGGGGHASAAFARTSMPADLVVERSVEVLAKHLNHVLTARDLMSYPVKTIDQDLPVHAAQLQLVRSGHNGFPVVSDGRLVGILSRRDIERAQRHQMSHLPVSSIMTRKVISASADTSQVELERMIKERHVGRIPIVHEGELIGIVTRTDVLAPYHQAERHQDLAAKVLRRLPVAAKEVLKLLKKVVKGRLYVVGGTVRDALLGASLKDLDLMVTADSAERIASVLAQALGGTISQHQDFGTASVHLTSGLEIDIATAREEYYAHPGALPEVTPSTLPKDLARRDFSINTLTVEVVPEQRLIDLYGGLDDLERKVLRALHPLLFVEDATRIIRGARLAARLGLDLDEESLIAIERALKPEMIDQTKGARFRAELMLCLAERHVAPVIDLLASIGALAAIYQMHADPGLAQLDALRREQSISEESYLLLLLMTVDEAQLAHHKERFQWSKRILHERHILKQARRDDSITEEAISKLSEAAQLVLQVLSPGLKALTDVVLYAPPRRKLTGKDVLDLGLEEGPVVGEVLQAVSEARSREQVVSFEEELELARTLVQARFGEKYGS